MKPLMRWNSDTSFQWEWALFIPYTIKTTPYVKLIAKKFVTMNYVYETIPYTTFGANPSTEDAGQTSEIQHIWGFFLSLACIPDMWQILMLLLHVLLSSVVLFSVSQPLLSQRYPTFVWAIFEILQRKLHKSPFYPAQSYLRASLGLTPGNCHIWTTW